MKSVYLIDSLPYVFRAYFALPEIRSPRGQNVNAVYGFASFLIKLLLEENPDYVAATFDESLTSSFRNEIYPEYKTNRVLPPPELEAQLKYCQQVAGVLGCGVLADDRYEADDLIATLRKRFHGSGRRFVVVSGDKDLMQLVDDSTEYYHFAKGARLRAAEVEKEMGVKPEQIPDFLGLQGDAVDHIPGVHGVGAKTAAALIGEFGSLENLYKNLDRVKRMNLRGAEGLYAKLVTGKESAIMSKLLATVSVKAPMRITLTGLAYNGPSMKKVRPLFEEKVDLADHH